ASVSETVRDQSLSISDTPPPGTRSIHGPCRTFPCKLSSGLWILRPKPHDTTIQASIWDVAEPLARNLPHEFKHEGEVLGLHGPVPYHLRRARGEPGFWNEPTAYGTMNGAIPKCATQ